MPRSGKSAGSRASWRRSRDTAVRSATTLTSSSPTVTCLCPKLCPKLRNTALPALPLAPRCARASKRHPAPDAPARGPKFSLRNTSVHPARAGVFGAPSGMQDA
ncbi:hypothetical protein GCM10010330_54440 [Streptomyces tendae]|nr:hypothetical protein GCM10010330_54440 [Streptomyces tendae]